jgi:hypothetical protein
VAFRELYNLENTQQMTMSTEYEGKALQSSKERGTRFGIPILGLFKC